MSRHELDGKPFYCQTCGAGFGEYMACDGIDCSLESQEKATSRMNTHISMGKILAEALAEQHE